MKNNIKVVALDLDGTLLNDDHSISNFNKEVLRKLDAKGIEVILCTGRPYNAMKRYRAELGLRNPVICFNGAGIVDIGEEYILNTALSQKISRRLVELGKEFDIYHHGFMDTRWLVPYWCDESKAYSERSGLKETIIDFEKIDRLEFIKLMYIGEEENLKKLSKILEKEFGDTIYQAFSTKNFLEVLNCSSSKAKALEYYLKSKGLGLENLLAMGDGYNDAEMLQCAEIGVIMENAPDELKERFEYKAPINTQDGVGRFLKEFFEL